MVTTIVAIRHAKPVSEGYAEDHLRPISEEGKEAQKKLAAHLQEAGIIPNTIWTSPLLRAQQSAEILSEIFAVPYREEPALGNSFDRERILEKIPLPELNQTLFLVGHAPTLPEFVNDLVGEDALPEGLSKSAAAVVTFTDQIEFGHGYFVQVFKP